MLSKSDAQAASIQGNDLTSAVLVVLSLSEKFALEGFEGIEGVEVTAEGRYRDMPVFQRLRPLNNLRHQSKF